MHIIDLRAILLLLLSLVSAYSLVLPMKSFSTLSFRTFQLARRCEVHTPRYRGALLNQHTTLSSLRGLSGRLFSTSINYFDVLRNGETDELITFGDYGVIASQSPSTGKVIVQVNEINESMLNKLIWVRGRVQSIRAKGNACFLVIRGGLDSVQVCHFKTKGSEESKQLLKFMANLTLESIVEVYGLVQSADVKSCSVQSLELSVQKVYAVSRAPTRLPFLLEDASRSQKDIDDTHNAERPLSGVSQDLRLDNRWLDLRVPANNAIMRVKAGVSLLFREYLNSQGFVEIITPKLIAGESEGGSDVFRTDYFGQVACLAQSPQLYKQMAISADLRRVFEIGPVFRAEQSKTRRHLCEFTGLDIEMEIQEHYNETLFVIHHMFRHIFEGLEKRFAKELGVIRSQYPSAPVRFTTEPLIIHWQDGIEMLRAAGSAVDAMADLNSAAELLLGKLVAEKYGADFFMLDQYPSAVRPFYTMLNPVDERYSNSYDMFIRGQEICSGAQRCHVAEKLEQRIISKGLDLSTLSSYVESFKHGVSPHAGAGIGLERVVFLYLGLDNVRKASMFPRDPNRITP